MPDSELALVNPREVMCVELQIVCEGPEIQVVRLRMVLMWDSWGCLFGCAVCEA